MEYKLVKRDEAFEKLLECLCYGFTIYVVRVSRSKEFSEQWVRFYYPLGAMQDITAEVAALFELTMVYGEPACRVVGDDDKVLIEIVEELSARLFDFPAALKFRRL